MSGRETMYSREILGKNTKKDRISGKGTVRRIFSRFKTSALTGALTFTLAAVSPIALSGCREKQAEEYSASELRNRPAFQEPLIVSPPPKTSIYEKEEVVEKLEKPETDKTVNEKLFEAVIYGDSEKAKRLLGEGADINIKSTSGKNLLMLACDKDNAEMVEILMGEKIDINATNRKDEGKTALMYAIENNDEEIVKLLLEGGVDIDIKDKDGETALMKAVGRLQPGYEVSDYRIENIIKQLIDKGADLNIRNKYGITVLDIAISGEKIKFIELATEKGMDVNSKNETGFTPLMLAAGYGTKDIVRILVEGGADVNASDIGGRTPLMQAAEMGKGDIVEYLLDNGASIDLVDGYGNTALILSVTSHHDDYSTTEILLMEGAKIDIKNKEGKSVVDYAEKYENVKNLIEEYRPIH